MTAVQGTGSDGDGAPAAAVDIAGPPRPTVGRRIAAAVALLGLLAALVMVVVALLRDPVRLVAGLVLVAVCVMAAWSALVHRGALRTLATVVAVAALVAVVVLLLAGSIVRMALVVVLMLVSAAAAKVALGHDMVETPQGLRRSAPRGTASYS